MRRGRSKRVDQADKPGESDKTNGRAVGLNLRFCTVNQVSLGMILQNDGNRDKIKKIAKM